MSGLDIDDRSDWCAKVKYKKDKKCETVPVSDIRRKIEGQWLPYYPVSLNDFKKKEVFKVKTLMGSSDGEKHGYQAVIGCLGVSLADCNARFEDKGRTSWPPLSDKEEELESSAAESRSRKGKDTDAESIRKEKKLKDLNKKNAGDRAATRILNRSQAINVNSPDGSIKDASTSSPSTSPSPSEELEQLKMQLQEKDRKLKEKDAKLKEKDRKLMEKDQKLKDKDRKLLEFESSGVSASALSELSRSLESRLSRSLESQLDSKFNDFKETVLDFFSKSSDNVPERVKIWVDNLSLPGWKIDDKIEMEYI